MGFSWVDWAILAVVFISALISLRRGFMKEAFSLLIWIVAGEMAWLFGDSLSVHLVDYIERPSVRLLVASALLFIVTLLLGGLISVAVGKLVEATGLSGTDRFLGMVFGGARGCLLVVVVVGLLVYTPLREDPWWKQSVLVPHFLMVADWSKNLALKFSKHWIDAAAPLM